MRGMLTGIAQGLVLVVGLLGGCADDEAPPVEDPRTPRTLPFGPFEIAPGEEISDQCVQITLHNETTVYVNAVELTTGPGFHHSNWFFVPEHVFPGEDGTYTCRDRDFDQAVAAIFGGVLFAQSTQNPHEVQQFPTGVALKLPPGTKIVSQVHLLNPTESPITSTPSMVLHPIAEADATTLLAGVSLDNRALALPVNMQSRFSVECDLEERHNHIFGRDPDFKLYYVLAHYHELGTSLTVEAVRPDGSATTVYTTTSAVGDTLGGVVEPAFSMAGYTKLRLTCEYFNPTSSVVRWGIGDQEMCTFLAFSDSTYHWGGGVLQREEPLNPMMVGNTMTYTNPCSVYANDATH